MRVVGVFVGKMYKKGHRKQRAYNAHLQNAIPDAQNVASEPARTTTRAHLTTTRPTTRFLYITIFAISQLLALSRTVIVQHYMFHFFALKPIGNYNARPSYNNAPYNAPFVQWYFCNFTPFGNVYCSDVFRKRKFDPPRVTLGCHDTFGPVLTRLTIETRFP